MANIAILTPHGGSVPPDYYRNILVMQNETLQHKFFHVEIDMQIIGKARNQLVTAARTISPDVAWFIDNDVLIPPNAGTMLDKVLELGIVSGLYFSRRPPYTPQMYRHASEEQYQGHGTPLYWPILEYPEGMMVVDAVGGGCLAVRMDVFAALEKSQQEEEEQLTAVRTRLIEAAPDLASDIQALYNHRFPLSPWFEFLDKKGEDMYFCERAREIGYTIWVDTTVKCQHLSPIPIDETHFRYLMEHNMITKA